MSISSPEHHFLRQKRKASSPAKAAEMDAMHKEQFSVPVLKMNE